MLTGDAAVTLTVCSLFGFLTTCMIIGTREQRNTGSVSDNWITFSLVTWAAIFLGCVVALCYRAVQ